MSVIRVFKKFGIILSKHQKIRFIALFVLMVIGGFMEMASVSLILPFIDAVMRPEDLMENKYISRICILLRIIDSRHFLVFLAVAMATLYILKNLFLLFQLNYQNKFVYANMLETQRRILHSYLLRPYEYYMNVKSGEVIRVVGNDTTNAFLLLTSLLSLFTELVVSCVLIGTIFFIAPSVTFFMAMVMLIMLFSIMLYVRPTLTRAGKVNTTSYANMSQWVLQAIQGVKEVKIGHSEDFFEKNFYDAGKRYVDSRRQMQALSAAPRLIIEAVSMAAFFLVVAFLIFNGMVLEDIIPILSCVAMAAIRLLPSVNRISQGMANIAFNEITVDKLIEQLQDVEQVESEYEARTQNNEGNQNINSFTDNISMRNSIYRYPSGDQDILSGASLTIKYGESVGIVGVSGAGKTTVADLLLGLLKPKEGIITVDGVDINADIDGWLKQVGYIPQTIFMLDGTIRDNVAFGEEQKKIDDERIWTALNDAALADFIKSLPEGIHTQIGERGVRLSGGQRQRLGIARALYKDPVVLFLDEATSALDEGTESSIMESINHLQGKKTVIIIAHRLSTIAACDHIYKVEDGKIHKER